VRDEDIVHSLINRNTHYLIFLVEKNYFQLQELTVAPFVPPKVYPADIKRMFSHSRSISGDRNHRSSTL
jgi:hypothetical protein